MNSGAFISLIVPGVQSTHKFSGVESDTLGELDKVRYSMQNCTFSIKKY